MATKKTRTGATSKAKAGGEGVAQPSAEGTGNMGLLLENFSTIAPTNFDWICPRCGAVRAWKKPWSPEGQAVFGWRCSWCGPTNGDWIWVPRAGWHRLTTNEDREKSGLPMLDHELRWMFVCECGAVHRPSDCEFVKNDAGETDVRPIEPTKFDIECGCGRRRKFRLDGGRWQQREFEHVLPKEKPPAICAPPPTDKEQLSWVEFDCWHCGEPAKIRVRSRILYTCERCGRVTDKTKHRCCCCGACGYEFTWRVNDEPWCVRCQSPENVAASGEIKWEETPSTDGALDTADRFEEQLRGGGTGAEKDGLWQSYQKASKEGRARIGFEVRRMADHMLSFLVDLADTFEDYDAVRWLAKYAELGKRRVPDDFYLSIEDRLDRPEKPRARREWQSTKEWMKVARHHVPKSRFTMHMQRIAERARWWRFDFVIWRDNIRDNPRVSMADGGDKNRREEREAKWFDWLKEQGIESRSLKYPAQFEEHGTVDLLIEEILLPMVRWWKRHKSREYRADGFPKDASKAALAREIRRALGIKKRSHPKRNRRPKGRVWKMVDHLPDFECGDRMRFLAFMGNLILLGSNTANRCHDDGLKPDKHT